MINQESSIQCPVCSSKILFEVNMLLSGMKFSCPNSECDASIGLSQESSPLVEQTLEKFEALKIKYK
jgi:hypothetical protein